MPALLYLANRVTRIAANPFAGQTSHNKELRLDFHPVRLHKLETRHPGMENYFQRGHLKAWSDDPYAMGAASWPAPGDVSKF